MSDLAPGAAFVAYAGVLGLLVGSFLNVCIVRWPAGASVVSPRSRCPRCGNAIAWYDNIPVVSWIVLRGRCRHCALPIPARYPLVELAVGILWAGCAWRYGITVEGLRAALFLTILLGIAMTDAREFVIPDQFSVGGTVIGLVLAMPGLGAGIGFRAAILGVVFGFVLLLSIAWIGRRIAGRDAMGQGDIVMMAMVGAFTGIAGVMLTLVLGAFVGILLHGAGAVRRRGTRSDAGGDVETMTPDELRDSGYLPFGVSLAIAAAAVFVLGPATLVAWYLRTAGLQ